MNAESGQPSAGDSAQDADKAATTRQPFTPGPWRTLPEECDRPYIRVRGTSLGARYKVANVLTPTYANVHPREADETRANARLIAAAPEMLAALQALIADRDEHGWPDFPASARARAVLSRVTGAQS